MKLSKIFLSETTRPSANIFNLLHHQKVLYQSCSNYAPGVLQYWLDCCLWLFPQVSDPGPSGPSCLKWTPLRSGHVTHKKGTFFRKPVSCIQSSKANNYAFAANILIRHTHCCFSLSVCLLVQRFSINPQGTFFIIKCLIWIIICPVRLFAIMVFAQYLKYNLAYRRLVSCGGFSSKVFILSNKVTVTNVTYVKFNNTQYRKKYVYFIKSHVVMALEVMLVIRFM